MGPDNAARRTPEGEPSFQATARGLQTLAAAGMAANLTAVVSAGSVRGLDRLLDFALWCGNVHGVGLDWCGPRAGARGRGCPPPPRRWPRGLNRLLARHDQLARLGRPVRLKELERLRLLLRTGCRRDCYCNAQTGRSLAVTPDGRLWPCSPWPGGGVPPGYAGRGDGPAAESLPRAGTAGGVAAVPPSACAAGAVLPPGGPGPPPWTAMHRRMLEHACRLEGKLEWWNTWKTAFPDRENQMTRRNRNDTPSESGGRAVPDRRPTAHSGGLRPADCAGKSQPVPRGGDRCGRQERPDRGAQHGAPVCQQLRGGLLCQRL